MSCEDALFITRRPNNLPWSIDIEHIAVNPETDAEIGPLDLIAGGYVVTAHVLYAASVLPLSQGAGIAITGASNNITRVTLTAAQMATFEAGTQVRIELTIATSAGVVYAEETHVLTVRMG